MFEAVLFDADNTIFNNDGIHVLITKKILKNLCQSITLAEAIHEKWDEYYVQEHKRVMMEEGYCVDRQNSARSLVLALQDFNINITFEKADTYWKIMDKEYTARSRPFPDAKIIMDFLSQKKIRMAIVSNGDYKIIMQRLRKAKIEHCFEFILTPCEQYPHTKPDAKIFEEALKKLHLSNQKVIFVGDSPSADIEGANQVGLFTVLIDRKHYHNNLVGLQKPKLYLDSLEDMKKLFD